MLSPQIEARLSTLTNMDTNGKVAMLLDIANTLGYNQPQVITLQSTSDVAPQQEILHIFSIAVEHGVGPQFLEAVQTQYPEILKDTKIPKGLERLKCANHDVKETRECLQEARQICANCRLVSYCGRTCQTQHWKIHKQDCKNQIRNSNWVPEWIIQRRTPRFVKDDGADPWKSQCFFGARQCLWGNIPAYDILNLANNEGCKKLVEKDLSLAFIASGDLRNVISTVNKLPSDYQGTVDILINDIDPQVVCRNFLILTTLGLNPMEVDPVEYALHLWYSVYLPTDWTTKIIQPLEKYGLFKFDVDSSTVMQGHISLGTSILHHLDENAQMFMTEHLAKTLVSLTHARTTTALHTIMLASTRVDYRERPMCGLDPSHRLAILEWRRFGLVHPFGAYNAHLSDPNPWLFSVDGQLCLNDYTTPFEGWDLPVVIETGKRHGTTREDIFGCLYFHLREQLQEFAQRLRRFKLNIVIRNTEAVDLSHNVKAGTIPGLPKNITFDRIEVSNIVDKNYVGVRTLLEAWSSLLSSTNKHAAIIGLFMNWALTTKNARLVDQGQIDPSIIDKFGKKYPKLALNPLDIMKYGEWSPSMVRLISRLGLCHDNSPYFKRFLEDVENQNICAKQGLVLRKINKIVASRLGCAIGCPISAIPDPRTDEEKYLVACLCGSSYYERYVEWVPL